MHKPSLWSNLSNLWNVVHSELFVRFLKLTLMSGMLLTIIVLVSLVLSLLLTVPHAWAAQFHLSTAAPLPTPNVICKPDC